MLSVHTRTKTPAAVPQDCLLGVLRALHASGYLKILYAILAIIYIISLPADCHAYARNDIVLGLRPKQKSIQSALINGMCLFEVSVRKANAEISAELGGCTSDCAVLLRSWRTKRGGIIR